MHGWGLERPYWEKGLLVAGLDEVGRGALAGPVAVAAVVLRPGDYPFRDSKTLTAKARELLAREVQEVALAYALGFANNREVDRLGVIRATHLAAYRALARLGVRPDLLITDYLALELPYPVLAPAKADAQSPTVAAASILAKVARDRLMTAAHARFPAYGFAKNKGYGTAEHLAALAAYGPSPLHRRRFAPVARVKLL